MMQMYHSWEWFTVSRMLVLLNFPQELHTDSVRAYPIKKYFHEIYFVLVAHLGNLVKFSQLKYKVSENEGVINIGIIRTGEAGASFTVKVLVENGAKNSTASGKRSQLTPLLQTKCYKGVLFFLCVCVCANHQLLIHLY